MKLTLPRTVILRMPRLLRWAGLAALVAVVGWGAVAGTQARRNLQQMGEAERTMEIILAIRTRLHQAQRGCELGPVGQIPQGLLARLTQRDDLNTLVADLRTIYRGNPSMQNALDHLIEETGQAFDAGRESLLLRIEASLARSGGNEAQAVRLEAGARPSRDALHQHLAEASYWVDRLEQRPQQAMERAAVAVRATDLLGLSLAALTALLLWFLWSTRYRRGKHLEGARLVENMLEAYSRRLELMNAELEQVSLLKSQFLSNTSHELLTPLNGIMGSLELLREGGCSSREEEHEFIQQAYSSAESLLALIHDLLDLCRLEEGNLIIHKGGVSFGSVLQRVLAHHQVNLESRRLALLVVPPAEGWPRVEADSDRVEQVLQHLISNAIKFTAAGSIRITGCLESTSPAMLRVEIVDTGIGIAADKLPRVFDLFHQVDGSHSRRFGGTGVGLTLSRHLIEGMGGQIGIESAGLGKGTRVYLSLPLDRAAKSTQIESSAPSAPNETEPFSGPEAREAA
jgi:signal transduction histidine kinase